MSEDGTFEQRGAVEAKAGGGRLKQPPARHLFDRAGGADTTSCSDPEPPPPPPSSQLLVASSSSSTKQENQDSTQQFDRDHSKRKDRMVLDGDNASAASGGSSIIAESCGSSNISSNHAEDDEDGSSDRSRSDTSEEDASTSSSEEGNGGKDSGSSRNAYDSDATESWSSSSRGSSNVMTKGTTKRSTATSAANRSPPTVLRAPGAKKEKGKEEAKTSVLGTYAANRTSEGGGNSTARKAQMKPRLVKYGVATVAVRRKKKRHLPSLHSSSAKKDRRTRKHNEGGGGQQEAQSSWLAQEQGAMLRMLVAATAATTEGAQYREEQQENEQRYPSNGSRRYVDVHGVAKIHVGRKRKARREHPSFQNQFDDAPEPMLVLPPPISPAELQPASSSRARKSMINNNIPDHESLGHERLIMRANNRRGVMLRRMADAAFPPNAPTVHSPANQSTLPNAVLLQQLEAIHREKVQVEAILLAALQANQQPLGQTNALPQFVSPGLNVPTGVVNMDAMALQQHIAANLPNNQSGLQQAHVMQTNPAHQSTGRHQKGGQSPSNLYAENENSSERKRNTQTKNRPPILNGDYVSIPAIIPTKLNNVSESKQARHKTSSDARGYMPLQPADPTIGQLLLAFEEVTAAEREQIVLQIAAELDGASASSADDSTGHKQSGAKKVNKPPQRSPIAQRFLEAVSSAPDSWGVLLGAPKMPETKEDVDKQFPVLYSEIAPFDVLLGRGGLSNSNPGNVEFRNLVTSFRPAYMQAQKGAKNLLARYLCNIVRFRKGRFLKRDTSCTTGPPVYYETGDVNAVSKCSQALRETPSKSQNCQG
eukprot:CAMPEP_0119556688 /NCGR_PEP_ID=MMETSP1352-20130426/8557_1 /TAXON_ID=265584 /ORGANISM="Stauroneis constricta, Strain CCMP1120" /LENGTH=822 /DNA_ID=CAMNT_0007603675 /DNA_START=44 /DNA_END=2512 /DNA_ORIENTATION=-